MKKDYLNRRSKDAEDVSEADGGDPLSGSADPFDQLVNSKPDASPSKNGKKAPSPIPDDSDTEDNDIDKTDGNKSEVNGDSADSTNNGTGDDEDDEGYEVDDIVGHRSRAKKRQFRIRWKNYDESADTWENEEDLSCPDIIERYLAEHPDAKKLKVEKKVRISLPPATPSRSAPKRTAAERKVIIDDDPLSDNEVSHKKKSSPKGAKKGGRGRPAKPASSKKEEYEVEKIIADEMRGGKKYFRNRWVGWSAKDDTWEPKSSLSCPEIIKEYESTKADNAEYEIEKIVGEKIEFGKRYFLVKWKGWPESDNTWEEEKSVECYEFIEKFRDSCRSSGKKGNKRAATTSAKASKSKKARKNVSDDEDDEDDEEEDAEQEEKEWEVEKVVNVRSAKGKSGKKEYLIRWKGCKASEDTWEPEDGINCPELIAAFLKKNKK